MKPYVFVYVYDSGWGGLAFHLAAAICVVVALISGWRRHGQLERIKGRLQELDSLTQATVGRCGASSPATGLGPRTFCQLPAGHDGWHHGNTSAEWSRLEEHARRDG